MNKQWKCPKCGQSKLPLRYNKCPNCGKLIDEMFIKGKDEHKGHPGYNMGTSDSQGSELI